MVTCPNCGSEVSGDAQFCTNCGQDLSEIELSKEEPSGEKPSEEVELTITTTNSVAGEKIERYLGIVSGEAMMGANIVKDFTAGIRNIVGGRSGKYEDVIREGREEALKDLEKRAEEKGADAVIGVRADYEEMSEGMLWMTVTGTAVELA